VLIALLWPTAPAHTIEDRRNENSDNYAKYVTSLLFPDADQRDPMVRAKEALTLGFIQRQNANTPLAHSLGADDLLRKD
jgi:hypothetical protein